MPDRRDQESDRKIVRDAGSLMRLLVQLTVDGCGSSTGDPELRRRSIAASNEQLNASVLPLGVFVTRIEGEGDFL